MVTEELHAFDILGVGSREDSYTDLLKNAFLYDTGFRQNLLWSLLGKAVVNILPRLSTRHSPHTPKGPQINGRQGRGGREGHKPNRPNKALFDSGWPFEVIGCDTL